jgi:hypothetical protein
MSGLDLIIIGAVTALIADPLKLLSILLPTGIAVEHYLDKKIKGRGKK